jgi:hypothetical protein
MNFPLFVNMKNTPREIRKCDCDDAFDGTGVPDGDVNREMEKNVLGNRGVLF